MCVCDFIRQIPSFEILLNLTVLSVNNLVECIRSIWWRMNTCMWTYGWHCSDVIVGTMASQITSLTIVYSSVYPVAYQRKHQSSVSLSFGRGIHRWSVNSPHKRPVTRKMLPFDDVIMEGEMVLSEGIVFIVSGIYHSLMYCLFVLCNSGCLRLLFCCSSPYCEFRWRVI